MGTYAKFPPDSLGALGEKNSYPHSFNSLRWGARPALEVEEKAKHTLGSITEQLFRKVGAGGSL